MTVQRAGTARKSAAAADQVRRALGDPAPARATAPTRPAPLDRQHPHASAPITASVNASVPCVPPMSRVWAEPSPITDDKAARTRAATSP